MTTVVTNTTERRARSSYEWVGTICSRFADATGWSLNFLPVKPGESDAIEVQLKDDSSCCWVHDVQDGHRRVGFLYMTLPANSKADPSFLPVCNLAETIAELLNKLSTATRTLESRTREISTLVDIGLSVPQEDDLMDALKQLLRASVQLTGFRATGFFLLDPATNELNLRVSHHIDAPDIPTARRDLASNPPDMDALARGAVVIRRDSDPNSAAWLPQTASMGLCVPVESDADPIGTLWAFDRRLRQPSDRETHVLESLAAQIATVLERVVLLRESETQQRLQRELQIVSENQPFDLSNTLPPNARFEAAARCLSAYELGGDLCEVMPISADQTVIAIGDASGDSIPAAIVMTAVRGALHALVSGSPDDALNTQAVMHRINKALYEITPPHQFMSFLFGILDTAAMTFSYTNAGHPVPLVGRENELTALNSHGMLLGVTDDATYDHSVVDLSPDDLLVFFSDGIIEAMNRTRQMFRSDGIVSAIKGTAAGTAQEILQTVWTKYLSHAAGGGDPDDRTLLVIRLKKETA